MTGIELSIKKAIEGGWKPTMHVNYEDEQMVGGLSAFISRYYSERAFLDPLFWQALAKSEGWGHNKECNKCGVPFNGWKGHWHRFIDHLAEGKDPNDFFNSLLSK